MRTNEIENQLRQRPFVPFRLRMSDGKAYDVRHPEMLMVSRTVLAVAIHRPRARQPEGIVFCDPVHIFRLEPMVNGRSKAARPAKR